MDELGGTRQFGIVGHLFFQPVLDRLDIVIGHALDVLDAGGVGLGKIAH